MRWKQSHHPLTLNLRGEREPAYSVTRHRTPSPDFVGNEERRSGDLHSVRCLLESEARRGCSGPPAPLWNRINDGLVVQLRPF